MVSREMIAFLNRRNDVRNRVLAEMVKESPAKPGHLDPASLDLRGDSVLIAKRLMHIDALEHHTSILLEHPTFNSRDASRILLLPLRTTQAILLLLYQSQLLTRERHGLSYEYRPRKK